jgi:isocitrate/isopropylmalate dehydrogenase
MLGDNVAISICPGDGIGPQILGVVVVDLVSNACALLSIWVRKTRGV